LVWRGVPSRKKKRVGLSEGKLPASVAFQKGKRNGTGEKAKRAKRFDE